MPTLTSGNSYKKLCFEMNVDLIEEYRKKSKRT